MSTNELRSQDCIGTENECAVCDDGDKIIRLGLPGDLPSVYSCYACAPAAGKSPREWFEEEFL